NTRAHQHESTGSATIGTDRGLRSIVESLHPLDRATRICDPPTGFLSQRPRWWRRRESNPFQPFFITVDGARLLKIGLDLPRKLLASPSPGIPCSPLGVPPSPALLMSRPLADNGSSQPCRTL